jgi:putative ABC transport system permease protein
VFTDNDKDAARITTMLHEQLPTASVLPILNPSCDNCYLQAKLPAALQCPVDATGQVSPADVRRAKADRRCDDPYGDYLAVVAVQRPEDGASALGLTDPAVRQRVTDALSGGKLVVTSGRFVDATGNTLMSKTTYDNNTGQSTSQTISAPAVAVAAGNLQTVLMTPAELATLGVPRAVVNGILAIPVGTVPQAKLDAIDGALLDASLNRLSVESGPTSDKHPIAVILAIAAALIALGATAISTGLAAADGRADLTTLAAVGASPRVRRQLSLSQSGVIALLGSALGVVAGLGAAVAVLIGLNQVFARDWPAPPSYPIIMPWTNLLISLIVVPVVAMLGAGLLTRSRLPSERRAD